jgi:glutamate/aspartate transport system substrate-binding protein
VSVRALRRALVALALALVAGAPAAQPPAWPDALAGRLKEIRGTGAVRIGYRADAIPFSYVGAGGHPVGYSLDLCAAIVDELAEELGQPNLRIAYVPVTPSDRIERVAAGAVDLECGSTTNTAERRRQVAFSPAIFITGTRIAVARGSAVRSIRDLAGRRVAVIRGTTNEAAAREFDRRNRFGLQFVVADGYREALALVAEGSSDALAADDVLLRGVLAEAGKAAEFRLVGDIVSFEPYGIAYPRDDAALAAVVDRTFRKLAASGEIVWIYNRWFVRRLPTGQRLDLPLGPQLKRSFELLGLPPD